MKGLCDHNHEEWEGGTVSATAVFEMKFTAAIGCSNLTAAEEAAVAMDFYCKPAAVKMREIIQRFRQPRAEMTAA